MLAAGLHSVSRAAHGPFLAHGYTARRVAAAAAWAARSFSDASHPRNARVCWSCGGGRDDASFFCSHCGKVQPAPAAAAGDVFRVFGVEPAFDLDLRLIEQMHRKLQLQLHPDRFVGATEEEERYASDNSARLSQALAVLRSSVKRADAVLEASGRSVLAEDAATNVDPAILLEIMEFREAIDEARTDAALGELQRQLETHVAEVERQLTAAFAHRDLEAAARLTMHLQYLATTLGEVRDRKQT